MSSKVSFFQHDLGAPELEQIAKVFSGAILTTGAFVEEAEKKLAEFLGVPHVLGVSSCTAGLHLSLMALGIGPGDEVITTPMTFVATLQAIQYAGAKPVLVDVERATGNIDVAQIEKAITPKTKAIMPVHLYGLMVDMKPLRALADKHGLAIIEDAAHCLEGQRDQLRPAHLGETACFSFFATKNITCGEGGAIATKDSALAAKLKLLRNHGMSKTSADRFREGYLHWDVDVLGWKYNMGNIEAGILLPQIPRIQPNHQKRVQLAERYMEALSPLEKHIRIPASVNSAVHARHLFPIWVAPQKRDALIQHFHKEGIPSVVNYRAVHLLTWFKNTLNYKLGDFPEAELIGDSTISIPFYPNMPLEHVDVVVDSLKRFFVS